MALIPPCAHALHTHCTRTAHACAAHLVAFVLAGVLLREQQRLHAVQHRVELCPPPLCTLLRPLLHVTPAASRPSMAALHPSIAAPPVQTACKLR
eukprot:1619303-Rhodomonas_salina.1